MRILTTYSQHRTATSRLASGVDDSDDTKGPRSKVAQLQNVPKKLRDMIIPDEGCVMIGADWKSAQWALCMWEAARVNEPPGYHRGLLDRFTHEGLDPHVFLASHFRGVDLGEVHPDERQTAKSYTYGRMFQGSPRTLAREAGHKDKVGVEVCDAHDKAFKLQAWWDHTLSEARKNRYVQTAAGWRRYFWELRPKPTEVLGTVIQGDEGDLLKYVLASIASTLPEKMDLLTTTHDSLLLQAIIGLEVEGKAPWDWVKEKMEQPIPFFEGEKFLADVKVGKNWREVS